jgi:hypothetical protein
LKGGGHDLQAENRWWSMEWKTTGMLWEKPKVRLIWITAHL